MPSTLKMSGEKVLVRSASGHLEAEPNTEPITFEDSETGQIDKKQVIVLKICTANLLRRDVMCVLGIGVVLTIHGFELKAETSSKLFYSTGPCGTGRV